MHRKIVVFILALCLGTVGFAQTAYKVRPGDTLKIEIVEDPNLNRNVLVLPDGTFSFPSAGTVRARGRTVGSIEDSLTNSIAANYATTPNVYVSVLTLRPRVPPTPVVPKPKEPDPTTQIFVMGEVENPGALELKPSVTVLHAIAAAGGPTRFAATKRIQIRRGDGESGERVFYFNYKDVSDPNSVRGNMRLKEGDVIVVPTRRLFE